MFKPIHIIGIVVFFILGLFSFGFSQESMTITTYYPSPYGSYKNLQIYNTDESTTQTDFTQALTNAGINIVTEYTANAYTPGVFWSTSNNNPTKPKAGIYMLETASGTYMYFGTSNAYATGITNNAMVIDYAGNITIAGTLTVNGSQIGAAEHVFDDYDDMELLYKWREGEPLPFETGDMLNRDRLLRDTIIQLEKRVAELEELVIQLSYRK